MTLPRILNLKQNGKTYQLESQVIPQLEKQLIPGYTEEKISITAQQPYSIQYNGGLNGLNQTQIKFQAQPVDFRLVFENDNKERLTMLYVAKTKTWSIDRSFSGKVNFDPAFAANPQQTQVDFDVTSPIDFELYLDWSSMELFLNNGQYCFTNQLFPTKPYSKLSIYSTKQELKNFSIKSVKNCWTKPKI